MSDPTNLDVTMMDLFRIGCKPNRTPRVACPVYLDAEPTYVLTESVKLLRSKDFQAFSLHVSRDQTTIGFKHPQDESEDIYLLTSHPIDFSVWETITKDIQKQNWSF